VHWRVEQGVTCQALVIPLRADRIDECVTVHVLGPSEDDEVDQVSISRPSGSSSATAFMPAARNTSPA